MNLIVTGEEEYFHLSRIISFILLTYYSDDYMTVRIGRDHVFVQHYQTILPVSGAICFSIGNN